MRRSTLKPPKALANFFSDPPLALNEKREEYDELFNAIAAAVKPTDAISWIYVRTIVDLAWEIQREKNLKRKLIQALETFSVADFVAEVKPPRLLDLSLSATEDNDKPFEVAHRWASQPAVRRKIDASDSTRWIFCL
jgi:hypothetical protein